MFYSDKFNCKHVDISSNIVKKYFFIYLIGVNAKIDTAQIKFSHFHNFT